MCWRRRRDVPSSTSAPTWPIRLHRCPRALDRRPRLLRHRIPGAAMDAALTRAGPRSPSSGSTRNASMSWRPWPPTTRCRSRRRLSRPQLRHEFFGDWYTRASAACRRSPPVQGLKIHLDTAGDVDQLGAGRCDLHHRPGQRGRLAGLGAHHQLRAIEMVLDAYEARSARAGRTRCTTGIEHAIQVSDDQLAAWSPWTFVTVIHLDGASIGC